MSLDSCNVVTVCWLCAVQECQCLPCSLVTSCCLLSLPWTSLEVEACLCLKGCHLRTLENIVGSSIVLPLLFDANRDSSLVQVVVE